MRKNVLTTALAGAALALAACAGDGTGPAGGENGILTAAEATELNEAILAVSYGVRDQQAGPSRATSPTGESSGSLNFTFDDTASCQPRGSVDLTGSVGLAWDDEAQTGGLSADFVVDHDGCAHRLDSGAVITLTGDPDIDVTLDATSGPGGLTSLVIRETGAFTWVRNAGNHGRCTLDVTAELVPATGEVLVSGSFCGVDVSGTYAGD